MKGAGSKLWIYDTTNKVWVPLAGTAAGAMSIHAIVEALNDIEDVDVATPTDQHIIYRDDASGKWKAKAIWTAAHKDSHDPQDGSDKLDTAAPVKVGSANAVGTSHSFARADHVHEREHAIYTDAAAKAAAVQAGVITDTVTKAPTHDAVYDVALIAAAAMPSADDAAAAVSAMGVKGDANPLHHDKYTDAKAVVAAKTVKLDDFTVPDDNTDLDATAAAHGLMPKIWLSRGRAYKNAAIQAIRNITWTHLELDAESFDEQDEFDTTVISGVADATEACKLHDADGGFTLDDVGKTIWNVTDSTYSTVSAFVDDGELTLVDDIMADGETYHLYFSRFTATKDGYYQVIGKVCYPTPVADKRYFAGIFKNGASFSFTNIHSSHAAELYVLMSDIIYLEALDYIDLRGYHNAGATDDTDKGEAKTHLTVHKLS